MNKYYITTPIYYVNDKPHIGHAYTTVVADILARYYSFKLGKENVWFLTGLAEHGSKIAQSAEAEGKEPQKFADDNCAQFQNAWDKLNIQPNDFIRTTEDRHAKAVKLFFEKLKESGKIYEGEYEGLYCVGCESFKKEADLVDGKCPDHDKEPEQLKEKNWFFKLSDYQDELLKKIESDEISVQPVERKKEVIGFINQGLEDIAISRQTAKFALPLPWDESQTIYVWLDELFNYCSAIGYGVDEKKFKKWWPANLHLVGKDIIKFHCIIWPALLLAIGEEPAKEVFAHGYFTIDGQKMSKTIGNVIDPNDLVEEYGADAARYLIISQFKFGQDGDVKADEFKTKYNADLANGLGNLVSRVLSMAEKYCDSKVPDKKFDADLDLEKIWQKVDKAYQEYRLFGILQEINDLVSWCDNYIDNNKPWALDKEGKKEEVNQIVFNLLEVIRNLGWLVQPILPEASEKILASLGSSEFKQAITSGQNLKKGEPLFLRK